MSSDQYHERGSMDSRSGVHSQHAPRAASEVAVVKVEAFALKDESTNAILVINESAHKLQTHSPSFPFSIRHVPWQQSPFGDLSPALQRLLYVVNLLIFNSTRDFFL